MAISTDAVDQRRTVDEPITHRVAGNSVGWHFGEKVGSQFRQRVGVTAVVAMIEFQGDADD